MHFIVLPVKFDGGLSISFLRNRQPLQKKGGQKITLKSLTFFGAYFSCERDRQPYSKLGIDLEVLFIYRLIPRKPDFREWLAISDTTPIGHFSGGFSEHSRLHAT
jgi:hypothetical protein